MHHHFESHNAGKFISSGKGKHITRKIDSWELIFSVRDTLWMFLGEQEYSVAENHFLLLPAGIIHGGTKPYSKDLSFYWIHFLPKTPDAAEFLQSHAGVFPANDPSRVKELFQLYLSVQESSCPDREMMNMILDLLLYEAGKTVTTEGPQYPPLIERLHNILKVRFQEPLSTSVLAGELNYNPDYLGRLYRKYMGKSITEELNGFRLDYAARLLRESSGRIEEIAYESGFEDLAYFRRCFLRYFSMTPHAYRKLKMLGHINTF